MIRITHPESTSGEVENSGLTFIDGVAEVESIDDAAKAVLADHGYKFDDVSKPKGKGKGAKTEDVVGEPVADPAPEITPENAAIVEVGGVEHVGELPADAEPAAEEA